MASLENVSVAIESAIHDALTDVVQRVNHQHGIRVTSMDVQWMGNAEAALIVGIRITTETVPGRNG